MKTICYQIIIFVIIIMSAAASAAAEAPASFSDLLAKDLQCDYGAVIHDPTALEFKLYDDDGEIIEPSKINADGSVIYSFEVTEKIRELIRQAEEANAAGGASAAAANASGASAAAANASGASGASGVRANRGGARYQRGGAGVQYRYTDYNPFYYFWREKHVYTTNQFGTQYLNIKLTSEQLASIAAYEATRAAHAFRVVIIDRNIASLNDALAKFVEGDTVIIRNYYPITTRATDSYFWSSKSKNTGARSYWSNWLGYRPKENSGELCQTQFAYRQVEFTNKAEIEAEKARMIAAKDEEIKQLGIIDGLRADAEKTQQAAYQISGADPKRTWDPTMGKDVVANFYKDVVAPGRISLRKSLEIPEDSEFLSHFELQHPAWNEGEAVLTKSVFLASVPQTQYYGQAPGSRPTPSATPLPTLTPEQLAARNRNFGSADPFSRRAGGAGVAPPGGASASPTLAPSPSSSLGPSEDFQGFPLSEVERAIAYLDFQTTGKGSIAPLRRDAIPIGVSMLKIGIPADFTTTRTLALTGGSKHKSGKSRKMKHNKKKNTRRRRA